MSESSGSVGILASIYLGCPVGETSKKRAGVRTPAMAAEAEHGSCSWPGGPCKVIKRGPSTLKLGFCIACSCRAALRSCTWRGRGT